MEELSANVLAAIWLSVIYLDYFYPPIKAHLSGDFLFQIIERIQPETQPGSTRSPPARLWDCRTLCYW